MGEIGIAELLSAMADRDEGERDAPRPLPEAQVATLREVFDRYAAGCPFKPGDLVTPRKGHNVKDDGQPHIVLEVPQIPIRSFEGAARETCGNSYGRRMDMRVACIDQGREVVAFWVESYAYEPYSEPTA